MSFTPAVTPLNIQRQGEGNFTYPAGWIDSVQSSSGSAVSYNLTTVRSNMGLPAGEPLFLILAADGGFWANFHSTAAIPTGNTTNGTASEYSPNQRYLDASITAISFISSAAQNISLQFYRP